MSYELTIEPLGQTLEVEGGQTILDAALRVIGRDGLRAVTHRTVATEARTSLSATTYYFESGADLIVQAFTQYVDERIAAVRSVLVGPIEAGALTPDQGPTYGSLSIQNTPVAKTELIARLQAIAAERTSDKLFLRADGRIPYERVVQVMGALNAASFSNITLVTDAGGPNFNGQAAN